MSAASPTPALVGSSFIQQYYQLLASERSKLPGLYHADAKVSHTTGNDETEQHVGTFAITNFFNGLNYTDVTLDLGAGALDAVGVGSDILIMLTGLIGFNGNPANMRFSQSILLGGQSGREGKVMYAVQADIFRAYPAPAVPVVPVDVQFGVEDAPAPAPVVPEAAWPTEEEQAPAPAPIEAPAPAPAVQEPAPVVEEAEEEVVEEAPVVSAPVDAAPVQQVAPTDAPPAPVGNKSWANVAGGSNPAPAPAPAPKARPSRKRSPNKRSNGGAPKPAASTAAAAVAAGGEASPAPASPHRGRRERNTGRKGRAPAQGSVKLSGDFAHVTPESIKAVLSKFGTITGVSGNTMPKGFAFVDFEKKESVAKAAAAGTVTIGAVTVTVVENKNFDSKRQARSGGRGGRRTGGRSGGRGGQSASSAPSGGQ